MRQGQRNRPPQTSSRSRYQCHTPVQPKLWIFHYLASSTYLSSPLTDRDIKIEVSSDEASIIVRETFSFSIWRARRRCRTGGSAHSGRRSSNEALRQRPVVLAHLRKRSALCDASL